LGAHYLDSFARQTVTTCRSAPHSLTYQDKDISIFSVSGYEGKGDAVISQTIEYALRAVLSLARTPGQAQTSKSIAADMKVPPSYLAKVLQSLARVELVRSTRGLHGGFQLVKPPQELNLLEVVSAVQPIRRIRSCPLDVESHSAELCPLHRRLDRALALMEEAFRSTTVADLLAEPNPCPTLAEHFGEHDGSIKETPASPHRIS
jgi:Rrf2 family protein